MGHGTYERKELWAPTPVTTAELGLKVMGTVWCWAAAPLRAAPAPLQAGSAMGKGRGLRKLLFSQLTSRRGANGERPREAKHRARATAKDKTRKERTSAPLHIPTR